MAVYKKSKVQNTKMQLQNNKLFCTELCSCETEDGSCKNLMLDDLSIDEDSFKSLTDDM